MSGRTVISVENLSKVYKLYDKPIDRLREALSLRKKKYHKDFFALKEVSFEVSRGEVMGVLGKNGSGKSTLLKILTGVLSSSRGTVRVNGKVTAMLELGAGFNPELSGLENIYFNGSLMGYSRSQMAEKVDEITAFADIGDFINQPVKTYSSGMKARLGFAVSIKVDPDILIVDEVLSVGDIYFRQKSIRKMKEFMDGEKTILFVTHDMGAIKNFCTRAIWLNEGEKIAEGDPEELVQSYTSFMTYGLETKSERSETAKSYEAASRIEDQSSIVWKDVENLDSFGEQGAKITHVSLCDEATGRTISLLMGGERVIFYAKISTDVPLYKPAIGLALKDALGNQVFGINNYIYDISLNEIDQQSEVVLKIEFTFPKIKNGDYVFTVAISDGTQDDHIQHHWIHDGYALKVLNSEKPYQRSSLLILDKSDVVIEQG